ncbi:LysR family transcriptional regulator [Secundilactobacillus muriivasis]
MIQLIVHTNLRSVFNILSQNGVDPVMNFEQLRYAEVLAHHKSMQKAADALHISKSGLSIAISQLESELGVQLFDKSANGTKLTTEGCQLLSSISNILHYKNQLESTASVVADFRKNQYVSIQYMNSIPKAVINTFVKGYLNQYSQLQLDIRRRAFSSIVQQVTEQKIDAGFVALNTFSNNAIAHLKFTPVSTSKLVLKCSPENPLNHLGRPMTLDDLKDQKFSLFSDEFDNQLFGQLQAQSGPLSLVTRVDDTWAMAQVVTQLNTVCFGLISEDTMSNTDEFSDLNWIDISSIIDDAFVLGWLTNPDHVFPEQARHLIDSLNH